MQNSQILMQENKKQGNALGLSEEEMAFYDALTKPEAIKDFYENEELIALTKELTETLRKNKTIDWQKRNDARARMRMLIKRLLKKYKYPPEGIDGALETVMAQCELWTDNTDIESRSSVEYGMSESKIVQLQAVKTQTGETSFAYEPYQPDSLQVAEQEVRYEDKYTGE